MNLWIKNFKMLRKIMSRKDPQRVKEQVVFWLKMMLMHLTMLILLRIIIILSKKSYFWKKGPSRLLNAVPARVFKVPAQIMMKIFKIILFLFMMREKNLKIHKKILIKTWKNLAKNTGIKAQRNIRYTVLNAQANILSQNVKIKYTQSSSS